MNKCKHCGKDIEQNVDLCPHCNKSQKEAPVVNEKDVVAQVKSVVEAGVKPISEKLVDMEARIKKIETLPLGRLNLFNVGSTGKSYLGYKLANQMESIRNIASQNAKLFPILSNEEKAEEFAKFFIMAIKALRPKDPHNLDAKMDLRDFYQKAQMQEGTDSEGGYLVPEEYQWDIIKLARNKSFALQECTVLPMSSDTLKLPKESTMVSVAWTNEESPATETEPTFDQLVLTAKRLDGYGKVTNELLQDSQIDIVGILMEQFINAVGLELDNQVLNGTGSPCSGVLTANAGVSIVMSAGGRMSNVTATQLSQMIYELNSGYLEGAKYIVNRLGMHYIRSLKDSNNDFIFAKPGNGVPGTIWEYPYIMSEKIANTDGTSKAFIVFGQFKKFYIGRRLGVMSLDLDPYSLFTSFATQFRLGTRWGMGNGLTSAFCRLVTAST